MKTKINTISKARIVGLLLMLFTLGFTSCIKDDLDVMNNYPLEIKVMPVPKEVSNGQTVEIRLSIQRSGTYENTQYYIRYFQYDGVGTLQYYDELPYKPNDLYTLPTEQFRLYYTSQSTVSQSFEIWISDNFGNEKQLSFEFNSRNENK